MEKHLTPKLIQNAHASLVQFMDEEALVDLLMRASILKVSAGTEFVKEGQTQIGGLYFILEGLVSQDQKTPEGGRKLTGAMDRGEFLGEVNAQGEVTDAPSSVSLRAQTTSKLALIPKSELEAWFKKYPEHEAKFMSYLAEENHDRRLFASSMIGNC